MSAEKTAATPFCCPLCRAPLCDCGAALRCGAGHSFDKAAQGYVHLLPSNKMHAKLPGDSREMVAARRRFLEAGHYAPFRDAICALLAEGLAKTSHPLVLDAGCGEGYYTAAVRRALPNATVCGFDISKPAVRAAAGRDKALRLAVASCFAIPLAQSSANALLAVFSPIVPQEFARVLRPGGLLLLAVPGERHLWGLKSVLYEHPYPNEQKDTAYDGFAFLRRVPVHTRAALGDPQTIADLFAMTPYYWKTPREGAARLAALPRLETELEFDLLLYQRTAL